MNLDVDQLFRKLREGDQPALQELVAMLYDELHRIAARQLRGERAGHTLQTTALVHEAFLKLHGNESRSFADRAHFLAVSSRVMRQVLVDYGRAKATKKRSDGAPVELERGEDLAGIQLTRQETIGRLELLDLDAALDALAAEDESLVRLIEMHYFGGMTAEEIAEVVNQSVHVVRHDLRFAQAWLRRKLNQ